MNSWAWKRFYNLGARVNTSNYQLMRVKNSLSVNIISEDGLFQYCLSNDTFCVLKRTVSLRQFLTAPKKYF